MAKQDEVLSREVAIAAKLEESGIAIKAKSRAVAAFDRLVGSLLDWPAAFLEGAARKKRLRDEIGERLKNAQARIAEQQIEGMPELGAVLIRDVLEDRARKQINVAGVAIEAIDAMKALPQPEPSPDSESAESLQGNIDEDWMNQFVRFAEDASSEQLQQVWGRVLAGEIVRPGSFSRHTLRFVAELDKETAKNCELVGRHVIGKWLLKDKKWSGGQEFIVSIDLQRLGVIEGVGVGNMQHTATLGVDGATAIAGKSWGIIIRGKTGTKISIPILILTRMGEEIMSLLNVVDEVGSLRVVSEYVDKNNIELISLGKVDRAIGSEISFDASTLQSIWQHSGKT